MARDRVRAPEDDGGVMSLLPPDGCSVCSARGARLAGGRAMPTGRPGRGQRQGSAHGDGPERLPFLSLLFCRAGPLLLSAGFSLVAARGRHSPGEARGLLSAVASRCGAQARRARASAVAPRHVQSPPGAGVEPVSPRCAGRWILNPGPPSLRRFLKWTVSAAALLGSV